MLELPSRHPSARMARTRPALTVAFQAKAGEEGIPDVCRSYHWHKNHRRTIYDGSAFGCAQRPDRNIGRRRSGPRLPRPRRGHGANVRGLSKAIFSTKSPHTKSSNLTWAQRNNVHLAIYIYKSVIRVPSTEPRFGCQPLPRWGF